MCNIQSTSKIVAEAIDHSCKQPTTIVVQGTRKNHAETPCWKDSKMLLVLSPAFGPTGLLAEAETPGGQVPAALAPDASFHQDTFDHTSGKLAMGAAEIVEAASHVVLGAAELLVVGRDLHPPLVVYKCVTRLGLDQAPWTFSALDTRSIVFCLVK